MSVFKVKLNNNKQGTLDLNPATGGIGSQFPTSLQRQIYVAGPNRTYRLLKDGEQFTDCNYWKRFTAEVVGAEAAFIEVVSDDGSIYSDVPEENVFSVGDELTLSTSYSTVDFITTYGAPARFLMIQNIDSTITMTGELNGDSNITFTLKAGETLNFNNGDMIITMLRLKSASGTPKATYIASVKSTPTS